MMKQLVRPLTAILLQALLPRPFPRLAILDLPLIVTVFFAVSRRNPVAGCLTGAAIGLFQDALTHQPLGVYGIAKAIIGYEFPVPGASKESTGGGLKPLPSARSVAWSSRPPVPEAIAAMR